MAQHPIMTDKYPASIAIEGPIGVGKTTLAHQIAMRLKMTPMLEDIGRNSFLQRFYKDPRRVALAAQLSFLLQRVEQLRELRQTDIFRPRGWVADFMLAKDRLFAGVNLNQEEMELYRSIYKLIIPEIPKPELVVYLQAPVEVLMDRIERRGIPYEQDIQADYLERICEAYVEFFHSYQATPLLIVNVANYNLAGGERELNELLERIRALSPGRHYFNPGHW